MKRLIRKITPKHTPSFDLGSSITMNAVKAVIDVNNANAKVISCSLFIMAWPPFLMRLIAIVHTHNRMKHPSVRPNA